MDEVTTQPLAGAHGEMTGIMVIAAYHKARGEQRKYVIVPDSSHGTNPASAAMAGYEIITIPTAPYGDMDLDAYRAAMNGEVAAVMMTCPNTLGLFNPHIAEICDIAHDAGALTYYDGANLNAILGKVRPGDVGFDVIHVNLHKTFGTPHGGGGPGSGPVGVKKGADPVPADAAGGEERRRQLRRRGRDPESIGRVSDFFGNFGIMARAFAYITMLGREGLIEVSEQAVLNANYMMARLKGEYELPFDTTCMHECVFSASRQLKDGRARHRHRQVPDRPRLPPADRLLPAEREGGDHDRADRDREQGDHGRLHRGDDRGGADGGARSRDAARGAGHHADVAAGRDQGGTGAEGLLWLRPVVPLPDNHVNRPLQLQRPYVPHARWEEAVKNVRLSCYALEQLPFCACRLPVRRLSAAPVSHRFLPRCRSCRRRFWGMPG